MSLRMQSRSLGASLFSVSVFCNKSSTLHQICVNSLKIKFYNSIYSYGSELKKM